MLFAPAAAAWSIVAGPQSAVNLRQRRRVRGKTHPAARGASRVVTRSRDERDAFPRPTATLSCAVGVARPMGYVHPRVHSHARARVELARMPGASTPTHLLPGCRVSGVRCAEQGPSASCGA